MILRYRTFGPNLHKFKMANKKRNVQIAIKVFKCAQEKQSESMSQPCTCTITVYAKMGHFLG